MKGPQENGPGTAETVQALEGIHLGQTNDQDCAARAARDQADKVVATAKAKLAILGYQLHIIDGGSGRGGAFLVMRWDRTRELRGLDAVHAFIRQVGGEA